jgi:hypothetical protein
MSRSSPRSSAQGHGLNIAPRRRIPDPFDPLRADESQSRRCACDQHRGKTGAFLRNQRRRVTEAAGMPDPISANRPLESASTDYDPYSDEVGMMSRADAPNSSQAQPAAISSQAQPAAISSESEPTAASPSAVPKLVSSVPPPPSVLPPPSPTPPGSAANNNAQRTDERLGVAPYASAGRTAAGDSLYAGAALLKGRDASGAAIEVLSASAQVGAQNELQFGFQRVAGTSGALSGSVETFSARANVGIYNDDGSVGRNIGVGVTAVGFEGTIGSGTSVTYGVGAGLGAGGSVGTRDGDRDGKNELCGRVSVGPITLGLCVENPL